MDLLEANKIISNKETKEVYVNNTELVDILNSDSFSLFDVKFFNSTDDCKYFFKNSPLLEALFKKVSKEHEVSLERLEEEWFYSNKIGYIVEGFPAKYYYLMSKSVKVNKTPNRVIKSLGFNYLNNVIKYDVLKALNTLFEYEVKLLGENKLMVTNDKYIEVYIKNIDDVFIANEKVKSTLTNDDLLSLTYDNKLGLVLNGKVLLRCLIYDIPIVYNELDWSDL